MCTCLFLLIILLSLCYRQCNKSPPSLHISLTIHNSLHQGTHYDHIIILWLEPPASYIIMFYHFFYLRFYSRDVGWGEGGDSSLKGLMADVFLDLINCYNLTIWIVFLFHMQSFIACSLAGLPTWLDEEMIGWMRKWLGFSFICLVFCNLVGFIRMMFFTWLYSLFMGLTLAWLFLVLSALG